MACPLFLPNTPLGGFVPDALPLGDLYGGECAAAPDLQIPPDTLRVCCNHGYARGTCERAAAVREDAVRFLIRSHGSDAVEVMWAAEANHHPVAVGAVFVREPKDATDHILGRQARAYVSSYLRQTGQR